MKKICDKFTIIPNQYYAGVQLFSVGSKLQYKQNYCVHTLFVDVDYYNYFDCYYIFHIAVNFDFHFLLHYILRSLNSSIFSKNAPFITATRIISIRIYET